MIDIFTPYLNLGLLGVFWILAGIGTGIYAMGIWQGFQEEEFGLPIADLGHKWFFMSCACPPASMLTTKLFFPNVKFRVPRWTRA
ncbi:hypothetical protein [uncultured Roseovarius sp.]|uniref:hypothetical protein n=1 Tax=uncultured Roseovarius sp. TaxID=293344 RepID=UPI002601C160|nr:hypothetical protein [uncultured Roseovarius sp.]